MDKVAGSSIGTDKLSCAFRELSQSILGSLLVQFLCERYHYIRHNWKPFASFFFVLNRVGKTPTFHVYSLTAPNE